MPFTGQIAEVIVYDRALAEEDTGIVRQFEQPLPNAVDQCLLIPAGEIGSADGTGKQDITYDHQLLVGA